MWSSATASRSYDLPVRLVDRLIARSLPAVPRPLVRRFADRYMAGETLADAVSTVRALNEAGASATIDVLGEFVDRRGQAEEAVEEYERAVAAIVEHELDAGISVKPTALGLEIDPQFGLENVRRVVAAAAPHGMFTRIDMEHSGVTDQTIGIYRTLRSEGFERIGVVLQSYLKRSLADIESMSDLTPNVRLVKGIYVEPPEIAYRDPAMVNRSFIRMLEALLDGGSYVAVASHDDRLVDQAIEVIDARGAGTDRHEFQLLLGVREELRDRLISSGRKVRIYVPYGEAWYGYSMRRLQENPQLAGYVARDTLRAVLPG